MSLALVRRKGSKNWHMHGTVRGQSIRESTGTDDKKAADAIRIQRETCLLNESVYGKKATVTFAEAANSYLASGGSARFLGSEIDGKWTGLIGHFYNTLLHTVGQDELNNAADKLYPNTNHQTRNRQCFTPFIAVWNHAVTNKWAEFRKWNRPRKPKGTTVVSFKPTRAGTRPVDYQRAADFVLAMGPAAAMVMTALFYTGARPIELFSLEAESVDIEKRWLVFPNTKIGEPRGVPIHEFLVPMFTALKARGGRMFRTPRGVPYPVRELLSGQMKTAIKFARKRTGIVDVSPYTARHTVSTQLVVNGVHAHVKDQILGHAVDDMSRHYTYVPQLPMIAAINTLPVVKAWGDAPWMKDPVGWTNRRIEVVQKFAREKTA
jgi:integrase/recombinase XerD